MEKLKEAVSAIKEGKKAHGKKLLIEVLQDDPKNEVAWLWMSTVLQDISQKEECLEKVLELNPNNQSAQKGLASLQKKRRLDSPKPSPTPPPATASFNTAPAEEKAPLSAKEKELLGLSGLIAHELEQGTSSRRITEQLTRRGFPQESVEKLVKEIAGKVQPKRATNTMSLSELLFSFDGRIPRSTYWFYNIAYFFIALIAFFIDFASGSFQQGTPIGIVSLTVGLIAVLPTFAVSVKRIHDRDHSGWFLLLGLIPFVSFWVSIELAFLPGTYGTNQYGKDPHRRS